MPNISHIILIIDPDFGFDVPFPYIIFKKSFNYFQKVSFILAIGLDIHHQIFKKWSWIFPNSFTKGFWYDNGFFFFEILFYEHLNYICFSFLCNHIFKIRNLSIKPLSDSICDLIIILRVTIPIWTIIISPFISFRLNFSIWLI